MTLVKENARYVSRSIPGGTGRLIRGLSRSSIGIADIVPRTALFPAKVFIIFGPPAPGLDFAPNKLALLRKIMRHVQTELSRTRDSGPELASAFGVALAGPSGQCSGSPQSGQLLHSASHMNMGVSST